MQLEVLAWSLLPSKWCLCLVSPGFAPRRAMTLGSAPYTPDTLLRKYRLVHECVHN